MAERTIIKRIRRAKLFVFLRHHRHELFTDAVQQELATLYKESPQGYPPVPPAHVPEARETDAIEADLAAHQCTLTALHIDRASLGSTLV